MRSVSAKSVIAFTLFFILCPEMVWAKSCKCSYQPTPDLLLQADIVFLGKALNNNRESLAPKRSRARRESVKFEVSRVWKGPVGKHLTLMVLDDPKSCDGFRFRDGREYLVFAKEIKYPFLFITRTGYDVMHCNGTSELSFGKRRLSELGAGTPVT